MKEAPQVHIIDDDPGIRKSLSIALEYEGLHSVAYESADDFLSRFEPARPGCIVLDLRMPGLDGIELLELLRSRSCNIPVIIMSGQADISTTIRGMKLGAVDMLQKPFEASALRPLVQKAVSDSVLMCTQSDEKEAIRHRFAALTTRERELLKLVVAGHSNKQIAYELHISVKTVANHRAHLMEKTQAANAADLCG